MRDARGVGLVVEQHGSETHRAKHANVVHVLPLFFHALLARCRCLQRRHSQLVLLRGAPRLVCLSGSSRTFSANRYPVGCKFKHQLHVSFTAMCVCVCV